MKIVDCDMLEIETADAGLIVSVQVGFDVEAKPPRIYVRKVDPIGEWVRWKGEVGVLVDVTNG